MEDIVFVIVIGTTKVTPKKVVSVYIPITICEYYMFIPYQSHKYFLLESHQGQISILI